jgi:hypothetical protein
VASNYPGSLDSFDTIASDKKTSDSVGGRTHRQMHNDLGDAIESVQTELGTTPSGSYATVKARFEAIEGSTLPQVDAKGDLIVGTADNTYDNLGVGTNDTVLLAASGETKGVKWAQVPTAAIQDSAVTSAKIADGTIVNDDINASAAIARSKISGLPTSSTDNTVARFDSTAGAIQTSGVVIDDNNRLTVATGATGGYGFASGAVHLSGTGSPEGVVTAAPGSTWLQTDATTDVKGWIKWVKATGTGNTGWQAGPEADTGLREIAVDGTNWSGNLRYRRIGNMVWYRTIALTMGVGIASGSAWTAAVVPAGFRMQGDLIIPTRNTGSGQVSGMLIAGSGAGSYYGTLTAGQAIIFGGVGTTADAWPSSLPGSAA